MQLGGQLAANWAQAFGPGLTGVATVRRPWLKTETPQPRFQLGNRQRFVYRHNERQSSTKRTPGQAVRQRLDGGRIDARLTKPMQISLRFGCCPRSRRGEVRPAGELQTEHQSKLSSERPLMLSSRRPTEFATPIAAFRRHCHPLCDQLAQASCAPVLAVTPAIFYDKRG